MANNKMLIDASHPEETRVVVLRGARVEEFDFESASKKPLRGNIYLAKVTRVEPSLQAAFVDYGGNRHGFLAFSEIHPDYYQIPVADRQALLEDVAADLQEEEERRPRRSRRRRSRDDRARRGRDTDERIAGPAEGADLAPVEDNGEANGETPAFASGADADFDDAGASRLTAAASDDEAAHGQRAHAPEDAPLAAAPEAETLGRDAGAAEDHESARFSAARRGSLESEASDEAEDETSEPHDSESHDAEPHEREGAVVASRGADDEGDDVDDHDDDHDDEDDEDEHVEQIGGDAFEEVRAPRMRRQYKIQEVIKRRQVLLVQVVKEERGNKGAALTTYLSLAGRYSVLMPNTARGGGISRKITDSGDRKRLKEIAEELEVPEGMGVILRTAGASRTRAEVRRDFEYLMRMWETVRETTLGSSAPTLVYEEGSLVKRAIRDLYNKDIDEVIVSGEEGYREARGFMKLLTPSHVRNVRLWREQEALFVRAGVESQLDAMFSPQVTLKSGGYLVINQTEALVAIDVNSGRSTREHNIEDTALRTNLEAADEVARQLRLRDLAGLIVVDFIDMEEQRNNRAVERRLKDALKNDRARIQVGRISHFGLLEMSRQRIRAGVLEGSTTPCPHCAGTGMVRSVSSIALHVLRVLEEALIRNASHDLIVRTRAHVALYILNQKRTHLRNIEERYGVNVFVEADETLSGSNYHAVERGEPATGVPKPRSPLLEIDDAADEPVEEIEDAVEDEREVEEADGETSARAEGEDGESDADGQRRRRRRRRRRTRGERDEAVAADAPQPSDEGLGALATETTPAPAAWSQPGDGYWTREGEDKPEPFAPPHAVRPPLAAYDGKEEAAAESDAPNGEPAPQQPAPEAARDVAAAPVEAAPPPPVAEAPAPVVAPAAPEPDAQEAAAPVVDAEAGAKAPVVPVVAEPAPAPEPEAVEPVAPREPFQRVITEADPETPKRGGWWQRAKATLTGN